VSFSVPTPTPPAIPAAPAAPPMFGTATQGQKPQAKPSQPTYLGAVGAGATQQTGQQKTLLGQ